MATLPAQDLSVDLRAVTVRPTWGAQEHRRWDRLVAEHHYLPFHGVIGKGLRHVAVHGETWLALIGWQPGGSSWPHAIAGSDGRRSSSSGGI